MNRARVPLPAFMLLVLGTGCEFITNLDDLEAEPADYPDKSKRGASAGTSSGGNMSMAGASGGSAGTSAGGSSGGTATTVGVASCADYCQKITAPQCTGAPTTAECLKSCDEILAAQGCMSEGAAAVTCIAQRSMTSCSGGDVSISGCTVEFEAFLSCQTCAPAAGDTTCTSCMKTSCCSSIADFEVANGASSFLDCIDPCTTDICVQNCASQYPDAAAALVDALDCRDAQCSVQCG